MKEIKIEINIRALRYEELTLKGNFGIDRNYQKHSVYMPKTTLYGQKTVKAVEEQEAALQKEYEELNTLQTDLVNQQTQAQTLLKEKDVQLADLSSQLGSKMETLQKLVEEEKRRQEEAAEAARQQQLQQQEQQNQNNSNNITTTNCKN